MHRADGDLARRNLDLVAEFDCLDARLFEGAPRSAKLAGRADEDANFVWLNPLFDPTFEPCTNGLGLLLRVVEDFDLWGRAIEYRYGAAPVFRNAIYVGQSGRQ